GTLIGIIVIVGLITAYIITLQNSTPKGEIVTVSRGDIVQEVFMTGTVEAARSVSLSFERGGVIQSLSSPIGTIAEKGAAIASLRNDAEYATVAESKALVAKAEANFANILQGTRAEEILLKEAEVNKAEVTLQNARGKIFSVLQDAYGAAEESLNRYADPFFSNDGTLSPRLTYRTGTQEAFDAEQKRQNAGKSVKRLQEIVQGNAASLLVLENALSELRAVQDLFTTLGLTLRDDSTLDAMTLADYRSRVTSARSALTSAITAVQNQQNALRDGEAEVLRATRALELSRAPARPETIAEARHELEKVKANLLAAQASLEKTLLRAPFRGQLSSKRAEVGETIQAGETIVDFLGTDGFVIEANVPETDVTKLEIEMPTEVMLDAYGDDTVFPARVAQIESAATEIEGVPTYKTTFALLRENRNLRSGLTANITLRTVVKRGVLVIPSGAVHATDGSSSVWRVRSDGVIETVLVQTGARSGSREVEIVEGLSEGDRLLLPTIK
ncbi:MAG: hypothetical protein A3H73_00665, partial [Candidatus Taylorbacteria bacterium RIFCSPLOWO2_02_FULL_50_120]